MKTKSKRLKQDQHDSTVFQRGWDQGREQGSSEARGKASEQIEAAWHNGLEAGKAAQSAACAIAESSPYQRVEVTSVHRMAKDGSIRAAGALADIPWNPHADRWPQFEVSFNGEWILMEQVNWHQDIGWIAQSVVSLGVAERIAPRVELKLAKERAA